MIRSRKQAAVAIISFLIYIALFSVVVSKTSINNTTFIVITSSRDQVEKNSHFFSTISINQSEPIIGVQIYLSFDATLIQCDSVSNANPNVWSAFYPPTIDNTNGGIQGVAVINFGSTVSNPTKCFNITWKTLDNDGKVTLFLHKIIVTNATSEEITSISTNEETIIVGNGLKNDDYLSTQDDNTPSNEGNTIPPINNQKPKIKFGLNGPKKVFTNTYYIYNVTAIDMDNDNIFYQFDWGDNTLSNWYGPYTSGIPCVLSHQWELEDIYLIKVKLKDTYNQETTWLSFFQVTAMNNSENQSENLIYLPIVDFYFDPIYPELGENIIFIDNSFETYGIITNYLWDFGDNTTSNKMNPVHNYTKSGVYHVTFTIWDENNYVNSTSQEIMIKDKQHEIEKTNLNQIPSSKSIPSFELVLCFISLISAIFITHKIRGLNKNINKNLRKK